MGAQKESTDIQNPPRGIGRRSFLKKSIAAGFAGGGLNGVLAPFAAASDGDAGSDGPILLVIYQEGGNDSLNTVIPHSREDSTLYYRDRPKLAIREEETLMLQDGLGLHPSLGALQGLWDSGDLAVVNGVGQPSPNLSHFKLRNVWASSSLDGDTGSGWLGRYFDHKCSSGDSFDPFVGLETLTSAGLSFRTQSSNTAVTMKNPDLFKYLAANDSHILLPEIDNEFSEQILRKMNDSATTGTRPVLDYARNSIQAAFKSAGEIQEFLRNTKASFPPNNFPNSIVGRDLRNIARYIDTGSRSSVYFTVQKGYDSHTSQFVNNASGRPLLGSHANLLSDLDSAIGAFATEMKRQGKWDRVVIMTYSEFSRKITENGTNGTDHGAAGSMFVLGGGVKSGLYGQFPSLSDDDRILNNSMDSTTDFRQVYRTILESFMNLSASDAASILRIDAQNFPNLDFLT